jgi:hypothetical protein
MFGAGGVLEPDLGGYLDAPGIGLRILPAFQS